MDYLLDSNLLLIYSRTNEVAQRIEQDYGFFLPDNRLVVSVVTLGELNALGKKLGLGRRRLELLEGLIERINVFDINLREVIDRYGDIDAYSQGKLAGSGAAFTARNMGKNDLWIAATASTFGLTLVTTDRDFDHLKGEYLQLEYIDQNLYTTGGGGQG